MRHLLSLFFIVFVYGCSTSETIIKPKEITIEVPSVTVKTDSVKYNSDSVLMDDFFLNTPQINDSFFFDTKPIIDDGFYQADFEIPNATEKAVVKVYPKTKKATLTLPKQTHSKTIQDTTKITIKKTTTTPEKFGYAMYGIIGAIVLIVIGYLAWRKYGKLI